MGKNIFSSGDLNSISSSNFEWTINNSIDNYWIRNLWSRRNIEDDSEVISELTKKHFVSVAKNKPSMSGYRVICVLPAELADFYGSLALETDSEAWLNKFGIIITKISEEIVILVDENCPDIFEVVSDDLMDLATTLKDTLSSRVKLAEKNNVDYDHTVGNYGANQVYVSPYLKTMDGNPVYDYLSTTSSWTTTCCDSSGNNYNCII